MSIILRFPTLAWLLLAYNLVMLTADANLAMSDILPRIICDLPVGKTTLPISLADVFVLLGLVLLFIEICKATGNSKITIMEHGFSVLLFAIFLVEFFLVDRAVSSTFLILMAMELLDVIAGFTITVTAARRDMAISYR